MEQSYKIDEREAALLQSLDQERTQALAMVGALSLDMEQAKKNLETVAERQRAFLRQALMSRGIDRYENARIQNGAVVVTVPDPPPAPPVMVDGKPVAERVNGSAAAIGE